MLQKVILGHAGCGGVLRSNNCSIIACFSCFLGVGTTTFTEFSNLRVDLSLYYELSVIDLIVETNSLVVINWLTKSSSRLGITQLFVMAFYHFKNVFPFNINHVYQENNALADSLAHYGAKGHTKIFSSLIQFPKHMLALFSLDGTDLTTIRH